MIKKITIFLCLLSNVLFAQEYCDCDTIHKKYKYCGYCNEYLDINLDIVSKKYAKFKIIVYYYNGKKQYFYDVLYRWERKQKNYLNGEILKSSDTIITLNGILETYGKKNFLKDQYYFQNGRIVKDIGKFWSIHHSDKYNGKITREIAEYDYPNGLIRRHYIVYNKDGTKKFNYIGKKAEDGNWYDYDTDKEMIDDIKIISGITE